MQYSPLLRKLLADAEALQQEFGGKHLAPVFFVAAVSEFCREKYLGITPYDGIYCRERFEEERLRYAYRLAVKGSAQLRNHYSRKAASDPARCDIPFDMTPCEQILQDRGEEVLSADIAFLCALERVPAEQRFCVVKPFSARQVLLQVDTGIYDYVIESVEAVCRILKEKADTAAAIRDWRPAAKLAEPEELAKWFRTGIRVQENGKLLEITVPGFFSDGDLHMTAAYCDGRYYLWDNGSAIAALKQRVGDDAKLQRILKRLDSHRWLCGGSAVMSMCKPDWLPNYLTYLMRLAHADLYYTRLNEKGFYVTLSNEDFPMPRPQSFDHGALLEQLHSLLEFSYDERRGILAAHAHLYPISNVCAMHLIETLDGGVIRISDARAGKHEGEILECLIWGNDDLKPFMPHLQKVTRRFGAAFDGRYLSLQSEVAGQEDFTRALLRFMNMAAVLSTYGWSVDPPERRARR